jgi:hypothetical protein
MLPLTLHKDFNLIKTWFTLLILVSLLESTVTWFMGMPTVTFVSYGLVSL